MSKKLVNQLVSEVIKWLIRLIYIGWLRSLLSSFGYTLYCSWYRFLCSLHGYIVHPLIKCSSQQFFQSCFRLKCINFWESWSCTENSCVWFERLILPFILVMPNIYSMLVSNHIQGFMPVLHTSKVSIGCGWPFSFKLSCILCWLSPGEPYY